MLLTVRPTQLTVSDFSQKVAIFLFLIIKGIVSTSDGQVGVFWQITDIHYDSNFSHQPSPDFLCHSYDGYRGPSDPTIPHPAFGDYNCDSPWRLVESAMDAMKKLHSNPDFVLWTGDNVPHEPDSDLNLTKVFASMRKVTERLVSTFEGVPIFPSLGNHDVWPSDQLPAGEEASEFYWSIYKDAAWQKMLQESHLETFLKGGYYSVKTQFGLQIINVNSVLWYKSDKVVTGLPDPANQLQWLVEELQEARQQGTKVIIAGHVPPGSLARVDGMKWFTPKFNKIFNELLVANSDVISATIFGHEHTDSFRITRDKTGLPGTPMFLAPAVTPWKSTVPGIGSNNPAIRLYSYNRTTGVILDYQQYFLNLSAANQQGADNWKSEYNARKDLGINTLSASDLSLLVDKFLTNSSFLFQKYYQYNSVSNDVQTECVGSCKQRHICAIREVDYDAYERCLSVPHDTLLSFKMYPTWQVFKGLCHIRVNFLAAAAAVVFLLFIIIVVYIFLRNRQQVVGRNNRYQTEEKVRLLTA